MAEGLQQVALKKENISAKAVKDTTASASKVSVENPILAPKSTETSTPNFKASAFATETAPVAKKNEQTSAPTSKASSSATETAPVAKKNEQHSVFTMPDNSPSDYEFSFPSEKKYTLEEYQAKQLSDSLHFGMNSTIRDAIFNATIPQKKDDKPLAKKPEVRCTPREWNNIFKSLDDNYKKMVMAEIEKYGSFRELDATHRIKAGKLIAEFSKKNITFSEFQARLREVMSPEEAAENIVKNPDKADDETKYYSAVVDSTAYSAIEQIEASTPEETQKLKEKCVKEHVENIPKRQKELSEKVAEAIPEDYSKDNAEKALKAAAKYTDYSVDNMVTHIIDNDYSDEFAEKMGKIADKIIEKNIEYQEKFIQNFWQSVKGRIIARRIEYVKEEVEIAKEKYEETKKEVEAKMQEVEEAKKAGEKAKEEVKEAKKKAANALYECGVRNFNRISANHKFFKKLLKSESPKAYRALVEAKEKEKAAYWAEWDANAAEELASLKNKWAEQSMAYANERLNILTGNI